MATCGWIFLSFRHNYDMDLLRSHQFVLDTCLVKLVSPFLDPCMCLVRLLKGGPTIFASTWSCYSLGKGRPTAVLDLFPDCAHDAKHLLEGWLLSSSHLCSPCVQADMCNLLPGESDVSIWHAAYCKLVCRVPRHVQADEHGELIR